MTAPGLPDFLVLGVPKAGTTSFHHYLSRHPQVFLPERKEVHYFSHPEIQRDVAGPGDRRVAATVCSSAEAYRDLFRGAQAGQRRGEASPSYLYFTDCYERIRGTLGEDVKLFVLLRNPVDRAFSNYLHVVRTGRETLGFVDALDAEDDRIRAGYGDFWRYQDHSRYADRLERLLEVFPAENVQVLSFHELTADPTEVVQRACRFLGIDDTYEPPNTGRVYNAARSTRKGRAATWLAGPSSVKDVVKRLVTPAVADRVRALRDAVLAGGAPLPTLDEAGYQRAMASVGDEVARVRERHGIDLSASRYRPDRGVDGRPTRRTVP